MRPEEKLQKLGITLPELPKPLGSYVPYVRTGNLVFISGMLPLVNGRLIAAGRVGEKIGLDEAVQAARTAAVNGLAVLRAAAGGLDVVSRCVKITGYVASAQNFSDQPKVINGASDLMVEVFGEAGRHARAAVGVHILPMDSPVEIAFIFEVR
ncbi:MAG TPA: RidA family protein [Thermodesulfovibrionales bacterium]|nr:RidA family protein [Thermodesulfovibrionales bacterium]